jgi:hypothetical protein
MLHIQPVSFPPRTSTYTLFLSLSVSRAHPHTTHTHKQLVVALIHIHCNPMSLPPRTYTYTLLLSHTRMRTYTHNSCLRFCAFFTATLRHFPLAPTPTPFCSLSLVRTHTQTTRGGAAAFSSPQPYAIVPSHLHITPVVLSHTYAHTHTQLVVAMLRIHHVTPRHFLLMGS